MLAVIALAEQRALALAQFFSGPLVLRDAGVCVVNAQASERHDQGEGRTDRDLASTPTRLASHPQLGQLVGANGVVRVESDLGFDLDARDLDPGALACLGPCALDGRLGHDPLSRLFVRAQARLFRRQTPGLALTLLADPRSTAPGALASLVFDAVFLDPGELGEGQGNGRLGGRHGLRVLLRSLAIAAGVPRTISREIRQLTAWLGDRDRPRSSPDVIAISAGSAGRNTTTAGR